MWLSQVHNQYSPLKMRLLKSMAEVGYGYSWQATMNLASNYAVHLNLKTSQKPLTEKWLHCFVKSLACLEIKKNMR